MDQSNSSVYLTIRQAKAVSQGLAFVMGIVIAWEILMKSIAKFLEVLSMVSSNLALFGSTWLFICIRKSLFP